MVFFVDVIGGIDVQGQQLRNVDLCAILDDAGQTASQREVLVEELEGIRQREERAGRDGGHDVWDDDLRQRLPAARAVDLRGFQHILRYGLQSRNVNDHHIADLLPGHEDHKAPEAVGAAGSEIGAVIFQDAVKDQAPDVAEHDAADQVRHEEHRAEQIRAAQLLRQGIGDEERQHIDQDDRHDRKGRRILERIEEARVLEDLGVVFQALEHGVARRVEITEGQVDALNERPDKADAEGQKGRQDEQRRPTPDGAADHAAVDACNVFTLAQNGSLAFNQFRSWLAAISSKAKPSPGRRLGLTRNGSENEGRADARPSGL